MSGSTSPDETPRVGRWAIWLPLCLFAAFVVLVLFGLLRPASRDVDSKLVGKPIPEFTLPPAMPGRAGLSSADLRNGQVHVVNIFASWCVPCRVEAPQLKALSDAGYPVQGISVRDTTEALRGFLAQNGDPFQTIGADDDGQVQLALGSSGVPETYIVDGKGVIRYQHIGEIRPEQFDMIVGKIREAGQ